jgi:hypothetical protein
MHAIVARSRSTDREAAEKRPREEESSMLTTAKVTPATIRNGSDHRRMIAAGAQVAVKAPRAHASV